MLLLLQFAITIGFKGKPTHHLIKQDDGVISINNKATTAKNIDEVSGVSGVSGDIARYY